MHLNMDIIDNYVIETYASSDSKHHLNGDV